MKKKGKQHILDCAIQVFAKQGFDNTTLRQIATAAGMTTGAIYHHYENKDDLFYEAVKEAAYFVHKMANKKEDYTQVNPQKLLQQINQHVIARMSKSVEQRLLILLAAYAISKGGHIKEKYQLDYHEIIDAVANMYFYTFGIENPNLQSKLATILVAALDGVAIQYALGVIDLSDEDFKKVFVDFFATCIPYYLTQHNLNTQ